MNRAGSHTVNFAGELAEYRSFCPSPLPPEPAITLDEDAVKLVAQASRLLQRLNDLAELVPDVRLFTTMYVRKEALLSSQIEGTQCTLDDMLDPYLDTNVNIDAAEAVRYVAAAEYAFERLGTLPLCVRLLRETHGILLAGGRGEERQPGELRNTQNWIGPAGCTLAQARYVPPNVDDMNTCLTALEGFMNEEHSGDVLVRAALIHYQFETIHPFLDGNGRIGRLLILLYLMDRGVLCAPVIYVSYFLKRNQVEYYDRMMQVRRSGDYEQWVKFFLEALVDAARDSEQTIDELSALHTRCLSALPRSRRAKDTPRLLFEHVEQHPIIDITSSAKALGTSYNTAATAVKKLVDAGILIETTNASRNRVFAFEEYLEILRRGTE